MPISSHNSRSLLAEFVITLFIPGLMSSCNKVVSIPNPISSITASEAFSSDALATSSVLGIYSSMASNVSFSNCETTVFAGLSADELLDGGVGTWDLFVTNQLTAIASSNGAPLSSFWQPAYFDIYSANAAIDGLQNSQGVTNATKKQLIGESKFLRAFCYFYLTNIFGEVPLVVSNDFNQTALLPKSSISAIYGQIIADLQDAQSLLAPDYSYSNGNRIRANKWAATALLARAYLYLQKWSSADSAASAVINSGLFNLANVSSVFARNSSEAILQLQPFPNNYPWATEEGNLLIPPEGSSPNYWLTTQLVSAFQPNDLRGMYWLDSVNFSGTTYYYPFKYTVMQGNPGDTTQYYMCLRLAEQYLIRAEADANLGNLSVAINDLDSIRVRAGLDTLPNSLNQTQVLDSVQQEDRIEFFCEWGHRWFDLRRWGLALQTLRNVSYKGLNMDSTQLLYPIPMSEIQADPNLKQNSGY